MIHLNGDPGACLCPDPYLDDLFYPDVMMTDDHVESEIDFADGPCYFSGGRVVSQHHADAGPSFVLGI